MKIINKLILFIAGLSILPSALAAVVSETQYQTTHGEIFSFNLSTNFNQPGTGSILTVGVQADLSLDDADEFISINVEGVEYGTFNSSSNEIYGLVSYEYNPKLFYIDLSFDSNLTSTFLSDGFLNVTVTLSQWVDFHWGWQDREEMIGPPFVSTAFNYTTPVPLPAGIYLFLSGLVGLGLMRSKNG